MKNYQQTKLSVLVAPCCIYSTITRTSNYNMGLFFLHILYFWMWSCNDNLAKGKISYL